MMKKDTRTITPDGKDQEYLQERYVEAQLIQKQVEQLKLQMQYIQEELREVQGGLAALDDIAKSKPDSEIMLPLANGIFVRGTLKETDRLLVGVGASVVVEKDVPSTKEILGQRQNILESNHIEFIQAIARMEERGRQLEGEMRTVIERYK